MLNIKSTIATLSLIIVVPLALNSCGGGGGGSSGNENDGNKIVTISGLAEDGYLKDAKVCLDKNLNHTCNNDEPFTWTDNNGKYILKNIRKDEQANFPIIVEIVANKTIDQDTGEVIENSFVLTTPLSKNAVISPITTLVQGLLDNNSSLNLNQASNIISLTDDNSKLFEDYIADENRDNTSKQLHELGKVIAKLIVDIEIKIKTDLGIETITNNQRKALTYLVNSIILDNIDTIINNIKNNKRVEDLTTELNTIVTNNSKTQDDFDNAMQSVSLKPIKELLANKTFYIGYDCTNGKCQSLDRYTASADFSYIDGATIFGKNKGDSWVDIVTYLTDTNYRVHDDEETDAEDVSEASITLLDSHKDYIVIKWEYENECKIKRLYFDLEKAKDYYNITSNIEDTPIPFVINKTIDSESDWNDVEVIYNDSINDTQLSGLDIKTVKMAQDSNYLYINLERNGLEFPPSDYYYDYWIYFKANNKTFSIEKFYDNQGLDSFRVYRGIGYQGGEEIFYQDKVANTTNKNLSLKVPKSLNIIDEGQIYTVTIFTQGFKDEGEIRSEINGESEEDTEFKIRF